MITKAGAIILACLTLVGCAAKRDKANQTPRILMPVVEVVADETRTDTVNLGRVGQGQTLLYEFSIENQTTEPLSIIACETGCGCVTAEYSTKPWAVGTADRCRLEIHTDGRNGLWMHRVNWVLSSGAKYDIVFRMEVK
ncbi:MAG: DUF1573 domain-containing protein [Rikenellaceae bacterium]|nr:DUF1573 domain-containing protein [Rikenellaceae bacterium]